MVITMDSLNGDLIRFIALRLDPVDLGNFCLTCKRIKGFISDHEFFWVLKTKRDYNYDCGYGAKLSYILSTLGNRDNNGKNRPIYRPPETFDFSKIDEFLNWGYP